MANGSAERDIFSSRFVWITSAEESISMNIVTKYMKKLVALLFIPILYACSLTSQEIDYKVDPSLLLILDAFYKDAEANGILLDRDYNLILSFGDTSDNVGGFSKNMGSQRTVTINIRYKGHHDLQWIVYHELGHSILNRGHKTGHTSIMSADIWNNGNLSNALITELYQNR